MGPRVILFRTHFTKIRSQMGLYALEEPKFIALTSCKVYDGNIHIFTM